MLAHYVAWLKCPRALVQENVHLSYLLKRKKERVLSDYVPPAKPRLL